MVIVEVHDDWMLMPPFVIHCSKQEEEFIDKYWRKSGYTYIVDPLGYDQCIAEEYDEMKSIYKILFQLRFGYVRRVIMSKKEYDDGLWKTILE